MLSKCALSKVQIFNKSVRILSTVPGNVEKDSCKLLVVGGGSGGCSIAAKFSKHLEKECITIIEPSEYHYYQPMFTLVGGGIKKLEDSYRPTKEVLPKNTRWIQDSVVKFDPENNIVETAKGRKIEYKYLLIAVGLQLNYDKIPGLLDALSVPSGVCSNYSEKYVNRTFKAIEDFKKGNAIFTYPNSPVKCPGAPQKICYLAEHYFRKTGKRGQANIYYNSSLPVIFGVKQYANALWKVVNARNITVNLRTNLIEIKPDKNTAIFENLDTGVKTEMEYSLLHVTPPQSPPDVLKQCKKLTNDAGFLTVNKDTLQHVKYSNIFGIGDCTNSPNSKTAAAIAAQAHIIHDNLVEVMDGKTPTHIYDGYASCPLVTGYGSCILAEFDYNLQPLETFPIKQDKELYSMYLLKKDFMPRLYWTFMLNGYWNGPEKFRKVMNIFKFAK